MALNKCRTAEGEPLGRQAIRATQSRQDAAIVEYTDRKAVGAKGCCIRWSVAGPPSFE
jgi:hypothetical protein